jgi:hypothetical protein
VAERGWCVVFDGLLLPFGRDRWFPTVVNLPLLGKNQSSLSLLSLLVGLMLFIE